MKTKERITLVSLALFNTEGEANVTTVDIANELDISPGNLYYHYKGKEPIITVLFDHYETKFVELLAAPADVTLDTEQFWYYLHIIFEEIHSFRFFYENIHDILHRIPTLKKRFERLLSLQSSSTELLLLSLAEQQVLTTDKKDIPNLATSLAMTFTHWLSFNRLTANNQPSALVLHQGVFHIMSLLAPHLSATHKSIYKQARAILQRVSQ